MICGIDLGTTNSLIALWRNGASELVQNPLGSYLTPSVVGLDDQGAIIVGQAAKERLATHPGLTCQNFKRLMGTNQQIRLGKRSFRAEELSSFVIAALIADAQAHTGETITEAIITVPAYFNDIQRKATKAAGELAGIKVERLLNEPTAAAMAFGLHDRESEARYLIFDLGGGTFDVSILELFDGVMEVHASAGDNQLGGTDFTATLAHHFLSQVPLADLKLNPKRLAEDFKQRLSAAAEVAKKALTSEDQFQTQLVWQDQTVALAVTAAEFEKQTEELVERIVRPIKIALQDANLRVADINEIVLVGGATRMPLIRKLCTRLFQRFPASGINPDEVVAHGAAIQAGLKNRDAALNDVVLTDVCPYTLGIEITSSAHNVSGLFSPIIERNSYVPLSRVENFCTVEDNQSVIEIKIFQGENPFVKDNIALGKMSVKVPKAKAGEEHVDVRFTYDINGILEVIVTVVSTQQVSTLVIEDNPGLLSANEIQQRLSALADLKVHPREHQENSVLVHRAQRLYSELLGEKREAIKSMIAQFEAVLARQDKREIAQAREQFEQALDMLEGEFRF